MRYFNAVVFSVVALSLAACESKKPQGFGLEGSPIRYRTEKFEDAETLAVVNGQKFTKSQILDKSPVLKDLDAQENEALIGLAYLKIVERLGTLKPLGQADIYLPETKTPLAQLLSRFDRQPTPGLGIVFKTGGDEGVVAQYKDIRVNRDELDGNHIVLQGIEQRRFREIASQLNSQLARVLVSETAAAKKQDMQSFLEKEVFAGKPVVISDQELFTYLDSIGFARSELTPEIKPRFTEALKMRKQQELMEEYVAKNIIKGPLSVSFPEPQAKLKLNDAWRPVLGYPDAPVAMVAFSGATCPDCATFIANLREVMKKYDGHLKLNWVHNFSENDGVAMMMAEGALCVDSLKPGRAVDFMNAFAKESGQVDEKNFYQWASGNKINADELKRCFQDKGKNESLVRQHLDYARKIGVVANPTLWVEGRTIQGVITEDQLDSLVSNSIQTKGSDWLAAYWRRLKAMF